MLPDRDRNKKAHESEEERIRRRAYDIWEREGRPHGRDEDHWRMAQQEISRESRGAGETQAVPATRVGGQSPAPDASRVQSADAPERRLSVQERSSGREADPLGLVQGESAGAGAGISDEMTGTMDMPRPKAASPRTAKPRASRAKKPKPEGNSGAPGSPGRPR